jgi:hypothetical protein
MGRSIVGAFCDGRQIKAKTFDDPGTVLKKPRGVGHNSVSLTECLSNL